MAEVAKTMNSMTIPKGARRSIPEAPIRVLFLDHTAKIGGGEVALVNLVRHLDRNAVYPIVLLFSEGPLQQRLAGLAETHVLSMPDSFLKTKKDSLGLRSILRVGAIWALLLQCWRIARFAEKLNIDLIHTNSLKSDVIGGFAAHFAGIPLVWHVRDRIEPDYLPPLAVKAFRFLSRKLPDFVIANSAATLLTLRLKDKQKGLAIASGIDASQWSRVVHDGCTVLQAGDGSGTENPTTRIGMIGRISPWKGQEVFIRAASIVHAKYPSVKFQIIGAPLFDEEEYEAGLHSLCQELGVGHAVEFTGFIENVADCIARLDVVVHASTIGEPFGQVIIEGMAEQKPIVATNGGGVPEIVQDGITGLLVPMGDAPRMAEAIAFLLRNPDLAAEMGVRGRQRVQSHFTIQRTARMVEDVYRDVLFLHDPARLRESAA